MFFPVACTVVLNVEVESADRAAIRVGVADLKPGGRVSSSPLPERCLSHPPGILRVYRNTDMVPTLCDSQTSEAKGDENKR